MRVLVVDDETALADLVARGLTRQDMAADVAYRGDHADELLAVNDYDVVVLDRDLPGVHGDEVARRLTARSGSTRILMLTAATALSAVAPVRERDGLLLGSNRRIATRDGRPLDLTTKELGVLEVLLRADGRIVSAEELLEKVWDMNIDPFTAAVRVTMSKLRKKLGAPDPIRTVPGKGYAL